MQYARAYYGLFLICDSADAATEIGRHHPALKNMLSTDLLFSMRLPISAASVMLRAAWKMG